MEILLIVAINGSPDNNGNTAFLLKKTLEQIQEQGVQTVLLNVSQLFADVKVPFCVNCNNPCDGRCLKGTKLEEAANLLRKADGIILGSPVYFGTITGQIKSFWDKMRFLRKEQALLNTVGAAVTVGAGRFGGQETTIRALHDMMLVQGMLIIGDGHFSSDPGHHGVCAQKPAQDDGEALTRLGILAQRIVQVALATKGLRK